ncbi:PAP2 (acid phosphatase) superfamily protein [Serratia fonticola]|uniref:PAP2 (Acid phosphatase) superfamily protein n=1 Tax=Serratia fonticola TaxID=47917 RepID=A0A4U9U1R0_SERFO|nr:PAP2 (acid phosphatase) superfamily protein [Serratia fonticola]
MSLRVNPSNAKQSSLNQSSTASQIQTDALYSLPASFYRWQAFGLMMAALLFIWLSRNEQLDWAISNYWYDAASQRFPWQNNYWLDLINHRLLKISVIAGAVLALFWGIYRRNVRLIVAMLLIGIGPLVVGILKATSAHSCPWDLLEYGGKAMSFPPVWQHASLSGAWPLLPRWPRFQRLCRDGTVLSVLSATPAPGLLVLAGRHHAWHAYGLWPGHAGRTFSFP